MDLKKPHIAPGILFAKTKDETVLLSFHCIRKGITGYQSVVIQIHVRLSQPLILVPDESSHLLRLSSCLVRYV